MKTLEQLWCYFSDIIVHFATLGMLLERRMSVVLYEDILSSGVAWLVFVLLLVAARLVLSG